MPTRPRNARSTKKTSAASPPPHPFDPAGTQQHSGYQLSSSSSASHSAQETPLDSLAPSPAVQLPTPLPEPDERLVGRRRREVVEDATAVDVDADLGEESTRMPHPDIGFSVEEEQVEEQARQKEYDDADADVLGKLIDFEDRGSHFPSSTPSHFPSLNVSRPSEKAFDYDADVHHRDHEHERYHGASIEGFLNDHLDALGDEHAYLDNPAGSYGVPEVYGYAGEEESQPSPGTYRSPPFREAPLPPEGEPEVELEIPYEAEPEAKGEAKEEAKEEAVVPAVSKGKKKKKSKRREAEAREREERVDERAEREAEGAEQKVQEAQAVEEVEVPVVEAMVVSRTPSTTSRTHSRSPSLNPPSLIPDLSSTSASSTFSSLSKTIRSYAPSIPIQSPRGLGSGKKAKGAPYPPLVSRPVVSGRVESGLSSGGGVYAQEYGGEEEYERGGEDESGDGRVGYGYGYTSKSPPATVDVEAFLLPPQPLPPPAPASRPPSSGYSVSKPTTRSASSRATSAVPERQGAWPEYNNSQPRKGEEGIAKGGVSRHRSTKSQGSQAGFTSASGLTQTLRRDRQYTDGFASLVVPSRGVYPGVKGGEGDVDRVVWARWDMLRLSLAPTDEGDSIRAQERKREKKTDVLVVGYEKAVRVWDVGNLGSVAEVLHLDFDGDEEEKGWLGGGERVGSVVKAVVGGGEGVLGVLLETHDRAETKSALVLYSMTEDRAVGRWAVGGVPVDVECSRDVFVVSTSSPPALYILSRGLKLLHTIPASSLALYSTPRASSSSSQLQLAIPSPVSTRHAHGETFDFIGGERGLETAAHRAELPHAVFALHGRLLAYAVPSPTASSASLRHKDSSLSSSSSGPSPSSVTSSSSPGTGIGMGIGGMGTQGLGLGSGIGGIPNTKAELGSAALKVGSGLIGGMRFLGGMALEGVKNRMAVGSEGRAQQQQQHSRGSSLGANYGASAGGYGGGMFSRSAPTNESVAGVGVEEEKKRRRFSDIQTTGGLAPLTAIKRSSSAQGYAIVVVDLASITSTDSPPLDETIKDAEGDGERRLRVVAEFVGSRSQPIAGMGFTPDGCGVYVVPKDGYVTKVFQLRPSPSSASPSHSSKDQHPTGTVLPLYELRRGRVSTAVVESVKAVPDSRWTGVVTRNRTLHVFATNPHGGKPHIPSHLEGRMRNNPYHDSRKLVELKPLARLTGEKLVPGDYGYTQENPPPAMAFTFVDPAATVLPLSLAPTPLPRSVASSPKANAGLSLSASPGSPLAPKHNMAKAPRNYQDVLLFDSATGVLSLQRITVESRPKSELGALGMGGGTVGGLVNAAINVSTSLGSKGISAASLPGAGPLGMTSGSVASSSVSSQSAVGGGRQGVGQRVGGEEGYELVGKVNVVVTWDLRKRRGCEEIRGKVGMGGGKAEGSGVGCDEWLAQAELSTFSKSRSSRSRSVYLTHQFSFHTLGEDYHALIRKYRLDVHGTKIDVRKDIPIHAFTSNSVVPISESFVEGFSPTRTHSGGGVPSSFDEPLASALAGEMEYQPSSNVLPMYPNGPGGGTGGGRSLRNSIPIRKIGDGVSEGLGRIRRAAVRSPKLGPSRASGGDAGVEDVLLEFDEEVDDFMAPRVVNSAAASQGMDDDVVGTVDEEIWGDGGWDSQDRMAVEEEEKFHAISKTLSPRFEEEVMLPPLPAPSVAGVAGKTSSKKSKKSRK